MGVQEAPRPGRHLNTIEQARVESLGRVCNVRVGAPADDRQAQAPAPPVVPGPPFPPAGGGPQQPGQARKIKLSAVLDPTLDTEIVPIPEAEVAQMHDQCRHGFGDYPTTDVSRDQLAALPTSAGTSWPPYAKWSRQGRRPLRTSPSSGRMANVC